MADVVKLVQPNCRAQFAAEDVEFILSVLGRRIGTAECLVRLLSDEESRDEILDDPALVSAVLERCGCLRISTRFYFYVLVRHAFRRADIQDRSVADYVAEMLTKFAGTDQCGCRVPGQHATLDCFFEMLTALNSADDRTAFFMRLYMGNYSLFLSGVFPERIRFRAEGRGFPDLSYYEGLGRTQYRVASEHRLAQRYDLAPILSTLSERFGTTRLALNDIAERLFSLGDTDYSLRALLEAADRKSRQ